jgi:Ca2+-transporting ATPase
MALRVGRVTWVAVKRYIDTDGEQRAASFAYYAFFALFPLLLLFASMASTWFDYAQVANRMMDVVASYIPAVAAEPGRRDAVIETIDTVVHSRKRAGLVAILAITWSATGFFHALVRGVNRAWGTLEYPWWRLPFKNVTMMGIVGSALMLGILAPPILDAVAAYLRARAPGAAEPALGWAFGTTRLFVPVAVLFYALLMFYRFAPRRKTTLAEVWVAAAVVTVGLFGLQRLFVLYAQNIWNFNAVYGAFGGVVVLLMWIYLSGTLIIFGGCLSAAQAETGENREAPGD